MRRTISFGKVDGYGNGRKTCEVTLELELRQTDEGPEFSCCANLWNCQHTDILWAGQCVDDLWNEYGSQMQNPKLYAEILQWWRKYHNNRLHAGTEEQEECVEVWKSEGNKYDYSAVCEYLKSIDMYEVEYKGKPYRYGSAWLYREIPEVTLNRIKQIISEGE